MDWNPNMDEAPKDGTEILACYARSWAGGGGADYSLLRWEGGRWVAQADGQRAIEAQGDCYTDYVEPFVTHWMPLPAPPLETVGG